MPRCTARSGKVFTMEFGKCWRHSVRRVTPGNCDGQGAGNLGSFGSCARARHLGPCGHRGRGCRPQAKPAGILLALEKLGADTERAVYVGDSLGDLEAGLRAGTRVAAVLWPKTGQGERENSFPRFRPSRPTGCSRLRQTLPGHGRAGADCSLLGEGPSGASGWFALNPVLQIPPALNPSCWTRTLPART